MEETIKHGMDIIQKEINGLGLISLDASFYSAVRSIEKCKGRVIFIGVGKSALVAKKSSSTFSSMGIPSLFVHGAEASHGDMGQILKNDIVIIISKSGNSSELYSVVEYCNKKDILLISVTQKSNSFLYSKSDIKLVIPTAEEADHMNIAPSTSVITSLAICDALCFVCAENLGFNKQVFKELHPGGSIGNDLRRVSDVMRSSNLPVIDSTQTIRDAVLEISEKRMGCVIVLKEAIPVGIITDGDLRRHIDCDLSSLATDIMTTEPCYIKNTMFCSEARDFMHDNKITCVLVKNTQDQFDGILHIHDIID